MIRVSPSLGWIYAGTAAVIVLASCAPPSDGPLVGPRVEAGVADVCLPASAGTQALFGEVLLNTNRNSVTITGVVGETQGAESVTYFVDAAGPALGQVIGAGGYSPAKPDVVQEEIMARTTEAAGSVVPAGSAATLYAVVIPDQRAGSAVVDTISVDYTVGGSDYREVIAVKHTVHDGDTC